MRGKMTGRWSHRRDIDKDAGYNHEQEAKGENP